MSEKSSIVVQNLKKSYGDNQVLKGVSFEVKRGSLLALLGPNGAGKTTIVKILSTLLLPDAGTVQIEGHNVVADANRVRSVIGLTGQNAAVDELLTARENLVIMGRLYRLTHKCAEQRAKQLLEEFDLVDAADRKVSTYSGGMRRRLDLAVSLIATPPIIFLDEPTTGLDPRSRLVMWGIIEALLDGGTTVLLTTQYLEEADQLADEIVLINEGKVAAQGSAKQLKDKIGKDRLVIGFKSTDDQTKAKKILKNATTTQESELPSVSIPIQGSGKDVRAILSTLEAEAVDIERLDIHKPTLDDVFLSITTKKGGRK